MTQLDVVLDLLREARRYELRPSIGPNLYGPPRSATGLQFILEGVPRYGAIIHKLRKLGHFIETHNVSSFNRWGNKIVFGCYELIYDTKKEFKVEYYFNDQGAFKIVNGTRVEFPGFEQFRFAIHYNVKYIVSELSTGMTIHREETFADAYEKTLAALEKAGAMKVGATIQVAQAKLKRLKLKVPAVNMAVK